MGNYPYKQIKLAPCGHWDNYSLAAAPFSPTSNCPLLGCYVYKDNWALENTPDYPICIVYEDETENVVLANAMEVMTHLEWFDSDGPESCAQVTDAKKKYRRYC